MNVSMHLPYCGGPLKSEVSNVYTLVTAAIQHVQYKYIQP